MYKNQIQINSEKWHEFARIFFLTNNIHNLNTPQEEMRQYHKSVEY